MATEADRLTPLDSFASKDAPICYGILKPGNNHAGGIPVVKVKNIIGGSVDETTILLTSPEIHKQYKRSELKRGDLLLTIRGSTGRVAFVPSSLEGANITQDTARIRVSTGDSAEYLYYALQSPMTQRQIELNTVGQAVKGINIAEVKKLLIFHPSKPIQTKIAQILSTWDQAIATTKRLLANSQQQKQALMQQLLTGQKHFPGFAGNWSHESFESLVEINYGKSPKDIPKEGEFPIIGTGGVVGSTSIPLHSKPAVVIGRKGTIDKPVLVTTPFWAIDTAFYCCPKPKCDIQWFYYICSNINLKTYNEASGVPSLSRDTLYGISVKTPSLPEQQKIAQVLATADAEIANLQAQLAKLRLEKKALMQQLLTGQRRVRLDAEAAA